MKDIEHLGKEVVDSAFQVHSALGPGLLEGAYEACLIQELQLRGISVEAQKELPIIYKGLPVPIGYRLDLLVEKQIIIELKSVDLLRPIHNAQLLTYLKLTGCTLGYLINFNVPLIKDGLRRLVLNHPSYPSAKL